MKPLVKTVKTPLIATSALLLAMSGSAFAVGKISVSGPAGTPTAINADVDFTITVPKILILRIGDWGSTVNNPNWDYGGGLANGVADAAQADWDALTAADPAAQTGAGYAADNVLDVAAFSNTGGASLTISSIDDFDEVVVGGNTPSLAADFSVTNTGAMNHPAFAETNTVTLTPTNGIVRETDEWTYVYNPAATPAAGEYNATVTYTLAAL